MKVVLQNILPDLFPSASNVTSLFVDDDESVEVTRRDRIRGVLWFFVYLIVFGVVLSLVLPLFSSVFYGVLGAVSMIPLHLSKISLDEPLITDLVYVLGVIIHIILFSVALGLGGRPSLGFAYIVGGSLFFAISEALHVKYNIYSTLEKQ